MEIRKLFFGGLLFVNKVVAGCRYSRFGSYGLLFLLL